MSNKPDKTSKTSTFEKALFTALKNNGFLFPVIKNEIDSFEKSLGNTAVEIPDKFKDPAMFLEKDMSVKIIKLPEIENDPSELNLERMVAMKNNKKKNKPKKN